MKIKRTITALITKLIGRLRCRFGFLFIAIELICFALSPQTQTVVPPLDGGYTNSNTAKRTKALVSLTTGANDTAVGFQALFKQGVVK